MDVHRQSRTVSGERIDPWELALINRLAMVQWHLLKPKPWPVYSKTLMHQESDYGRMTGGSFCEVNRRRRSRRGIRENFPQSFDRSRTLDASVFC
jgi:hypothetical protein